MTETFGTHVDGLRLRRVFGAQFWREPEKFGPDGWRMWSKEGTSSVIATTFDWDDGVMYTHASIWHQDRMPSYEDLVRLKQAVWGSKGYAYQYFVPDSSHVNINPTVLHLWGRTDGQPCMPDFGQILGSI